MRFVGRMPTDAEVLDMLAPYSKNSGEEWTMENISEYVNAGIDAVEKDEALSQEFNNGLKLLYNL